MGWLRKRLETARQITDRWWVKLALGIYTFVAFYDLVLSQFVPESLAKRFPKIHELITATSGWLPIAGWLLILAGIIAIASFEYAVRKGSQKRGAALTLATPSPPKEFVPEFRLPVDEWLRNVETVAQRRAKLIRDAREFVVKATAKKGVGTDFKRELEKFAPFFELRPHLSEDYLARLNAQRTLYVAGDGTRLPALASWFLDELDRLENEWGLRR